MAYDTKCYELFEAFLVEKQKVMHSSPEKLAAIFWGTLLVCLIVMAVAKLFANRAVD